jgi:hypothetical protein
MAARNSIPTAERLREALEYDRETGVFRSRTQRGRTSVGDVVGSINVHGYVVIGLDYKTLKAHRLAWLYVHGRWPFMGIDHIDGDKTNNRIINLREASASLNGQNKRRPQKNNRLGIQGVCLSRNGRYLANIWTKERQNIYLGSFDTVEDARAAYIGAKRELHNGNTL